MYTRAGGYHLTPRSSNRRVGAIPISTSPDSTCPPSCPFRAGGCYAKWGPLTLHWRAVSTGSRGVPWPEFCRQVAALPPGQPWRHNQAGDLPGNGDDIDAAMLQALVAANAGRPGWTYTHKPPSAANVAAVRAANDGGLTINWSANTLGHADDLADLDAGPVTVVLARAGSTRTPAGRRVVQCPGWGWWNPGSTRTCERCLLCSRQVRAIIGLPAVGAGAARAAFIADTSGRG